FSIDVLPPVVTIENGVVRAYDYVSPTSALTARYKTDVTAFTPWMPLSELTLPEGRGNALTVEVRDEEGNIGTVTSAIRGKGDATLPGGSGCGCSTAKSAKNPFEWIVPALVAIVIFRRK